MDIFYALFEMQLRKIRFLECCSKKFENSVSYKGIECERTKFYLKYFVYIRLIVLYSLFNKTKQEKYVTLEAVG